MRWEWGGGVGVCVCGGGGAKYSSDTKLPILIKFHLKHYQVR